MQLYVGTSGWAYKQWQPEFYPPKLAQTKFLSFYSSKLNAVEVNYTFRHLLSEKTINNWLAQTPETFKFALKANQAITHIKRLKAGVEEPLQRFLSSVGPLASAGRLGPVLFQLPPQMKAVPDVLSEFLRMLPKSMRATFEFRHESWFSEEIYSVLRENNAALCLAESDELATPPVATASFSYYRLRRSDYSDADRKNIAGQIQSSNANEVFAFFKHEETPNGALWAVELLNSKSTSAT